MRHLLSILSVSAICLAHPCLHQTPHDAPTKEIQKYYKQLDAGLVRRDLAAWKDLLSDDFTSRQTTEPERFHKKQFLAQMESIGKVSRVVRANSHLKSLKPVTGKPNTWTAVVDYVVTGDLLDPRVGGDAAHPRRVTQRQAIADTWSKDSSGWKLTARVVARGDD